MYRPNKRPEQNTNVCCFIRLIIVLAIVVGICYHLGAFDVECTPKDLPYQVDKR